MMLFTWTPVPGTITPAPSPFVHVTLHARPSPSMTEMWVVEPSRDARKRSAKPGSGSPSRKSDVRCAWTSSMTSTISGAEGGPSVVASRRAIASASSVPPAAGGGFVSTWRPR